jgi:hypothetical protein
MAKIRNFSLDRSSIVPKVASLSDFVGQGKFVRVHGHEEKLDN